MPSKAVEKMKGALKAKGAMLDTFERSSGVTVDHVFGVLDVCAERNVFLFLRPTDRASTHLIKRDYATKSMDIHHKSCNWGPMAGMVPVDPAFNKKCGATDDSPRPTEPLADPLAGGDHGPNHPHGASQALELTITEEFRKLLVEERYIRDAGARSADHLVYRGIVPKGDDPPNAAKVKFHLIRPRHDADWKVFWSPASADDPRRPAMVYAYNTSAGPKPVTGDYDMWMVSPHMAWWKLHTHVLKVEDQHGGSAATVFNAWLVEELNRSCKRSGNPVFNHGAEQQNYGFTQTLDSELAMFTPGYTCRMVKLADMPQVMAELMRAHYLVFWNKRYQEIDPQIMGKAMEPGTRRDFESWKLAREQAKGKYEPEYWAQSEKFWRAYAEKGSKGAVQIRDFYEQLEAKTTKLGPKILEPADFGEFLRFHPSMLRMVQKTLQLAVVDATTKGGESNLNTLDDWLVANVELVETLSEAFGQAPGELPQDGAFLLRRNTDGGAFMRRLPEQDWGWKPAFTEWDERFGLLVCSNCKKSAKLPNARCVEHIAKLDVLGRVCCTGGHPLSDPDPSCNYSLCCLAIKERVATEGQKAAIKHGRHA